VKRKLLGIMRRRRCGILALPLAAPLPALHISRAGPPLLHLILEQSLDSSALQLSFCSRLCLYLRKLTVSQMLLPSFPELLPTPEPRCEFGYVHDMVSSTTNTIGTPST
jgi:hypothetical protein